MIVAALALLALVIMASVFHKINVPVILMSLLIGIIFGSDVTGIIHLDDAVMVKEVANVALMLILFIGGFSTKLAHFKLVMRPVALLATVGVILTALITALIFHWVVGWEFLTAMLICSIISSTDAAAVFSILKGKSLEKRIKTLSELESVSNDPMAVVLTLFIISLITGAGMSTTQAFLLFLWKLIGGVGMGLAVGYVAVYVFHKIRHLEAEFFYIYMFSVVFLSYSLAEVIGASGMLSSFFAGLYIGNKAIPYKKGLIAFSNILSFITNVALFILLGLLSFPRSFVNIWQQGLILFAIITLVGRPITVFLLTLLDKLNLKEKVFLSAIGIRGAVPIVLATYPLALGLDPDHEIFNLVFFIVTLSMILQGTSIVALAKKFKLIVKEDTKAPKILELITVQDTNYEIVEIYIDEEFYEGSCLVSDLKLPSGTLITLIKRDGEIIAPSGSVEIRPRDTLTVLVDKHNIDMIPVEILRSFVLKNIQELDED